MEACGQQLTVSDFGVACCLEQEFSEEAVRAVLKELTPRNLRMMIASKRYKVHTGPLLIRSQCQ